MSSLKIKSKLPHVGTTIFTVMSKLANDFDAINLSQGFPNFPVSEKLISLVETYMKKGYNQYAPMPGVMNLREAISEKAEYIYGISYHPETEVTVTSGGTEALFSAISAVVEKGDEVIIFEPAYDSYVPAVELCGGIPVYVKLNAPDYNINWIETEKKITEKTKLIIINTPHNPTGAVLKAEDINQLSRIVRDKSIFIISDEVYEHIIFDGQKHHSVMTNPILKERSFIIGSFGKTFHVTGWKMGFCLAPVQLTAEFRKVHQFVTFASNTPVQYGIADFLKESENYLGVPELYEKKRNKFLDAIKNSRFTFIPASGSYFQCLSYKNISTENDFDLAVRLTKEIGVASIPVSVFYHDKDDQKILRFCFAKDDATLEAAGEKLSKL